jgi:hypothetical protein
MGCAKDPDRIWSQGLLPRSGVRGPALSLGRLGPFRQKRQDWPSRHIVFESHFPVDDVPIQRAQEPGVRRAQVKRKCMWTATTVAVICVVFGITDSGARNSGEPSGGSQIIELGEVPQGLKPSEWGNIRERIHEAEYQYAWHRPSKAYVAPNRTHGWQTALSSGGLRVQPGFSQKGAGWEWKMRLAAWGSPGQLCPIPNEPVQTIDGRRITYRWDEGLTEWYINDSRGIEQGFTIQSPPAGMTPDGSLVLEMSLETGLSPRLSGDGKAVLFQDPSGHTILRYADLRVTDSSGKALPSRLELASSCPVPCTVSLAPDPSSLAHPDLRLADHGLSPSRLTPHHLRHDLDAMPLAPHASRHLIRIMIDDRGSVYPLTVDPLLTTEVKKVTALDSAAYDYFGQSVAVSGDTLVVGAFRASVAGQRQGAAYVFYRNQGGADNWGEVKKLVASDGAADDFFGNSVSVTGETIVVGAHSHNGYRGTAYVFSRNQGGADNWGQVKKLIASDGAVEDIFGQSVSVSGDTLVVGAHCVRVGGNSYQGAVYLFQRNHGGVDNWGEVKKLVAADGAAYDEFGFSLSLDGDALVVGAHYAAIGDNSDQGAAYVFYRNQGGADNWGQVKKLVASAGMNPEGFGHSVSVSGDTVAVGLLWASASSVGGAAYLFSRNQGGVDNWGEMKKLTVTTGSHFGHSVAVSGDILVVGQLSGFFSGDPSGAATVFQRNQGGPDDWGQVEKLTPSDGETGDDFGFSVAVDGDTVVVGASMESSGGTGAAYVFSIEWIPARSDFNADSRSDILWYHGSGTLGIWLIEGTSVASTGVPGVLPAGWEVRGTGEFNGDGNSDILLYHTASGTRGIWLICGTSVCGSGVPGSLPPGWEIKGLGDFNGDGKTDILLYHTASGTVGVWLIDGTAVASTGVPGTLGDLDWQIRGVGDFNGDRKADILWYHVPSGTLGVWLMNGTAVASTGVPGMLGDLNWQVREVADFDGDRKADVLWYHVPSGTLGIWLINGAAVASTGVAGSASTKWQVKGAGDYNADGKADVLWYHTPSGGVGMWLMNGTAVSSTGICGSADTNWKIVE